MSESTNIYLDDPDPLSVLLARLELSAEVYVNGNFCGTWALDTGGSRRIPFHLVGEGQAWLHFQDLPATALEAGDLVIFPRAAHHVVANSPVAPPAELVNAPMSNDGETTQVVCGFFDFTDSGVYPLLDTLPPVILLARGEEGSDSGTGRLVGQLLGELARQRPGFYTAIDRIAFLLFVEVLRQQVTAGAASPGLLSALFEPRIGRALSAIHGAPEQAWTLESLAQEAAMSRSAFAQRFRQLLGLAPMKYLTRWRMNEARRLLRTSTLSTAQIAQRSGYDSEAAFRKAYKNAMGEPPGAARRGGG